MKNIILPYPVLLLTPTTADLPHEKSDMVYKLVRSAMRWDAEKRKVVPIKDAIAKSSLYGSEAAIAYCRVEGIEPIVVTELSVDDFVTAPDEIYDTWDILNQLCRIDSKVKRIQKLKELDAPEIIMINEGRQLWERIECFFYNGKCVLKPMTYEHEDADGNVTNVPYKCVSDFIPDVIEWVG